MDRSCFLSVMLLFRKVLTSPGEAFMLAKQDDITPHCLILLYGVPLLLLMSAGRIVHAFLISNDDGLISDAFIDNPYKWLLIYTLSGLLSWFIGVLFINRMSSFFRHRSTNGLLLKLTILSYTPYLMLQPLASVGAYWRIAALAGMIYTLYLYGRGARLMINTPSEKVFGFVAISFFFFFGTSFIFVMIFSGLLIFE